MIPTGNNKVNARQRYEIRRQDLPLHCPLPDLSLWNAHPRVYLSIEETGMAKCPYCGTEFTLESSSGPA